MPACRPAGDPLALTDPRCRTPCHPEQRGSACTAIEAAPCRISPCAPGSASSRAASARPARSALLGGPGRWRGGAMGCWGLRQQRAPRARQRQQCGWGGPGAATWRCSCSMQDESDSECGQLIRALFGTCAEAGALQSCPEKARGEGAAAGGCRRRRRQPRCAVCGGELLLCLTWPLLAWRCTAPALLSRCPSLVYGVGKRHRRWPHYVPEGAPGRRPSALAAPLTPPEGRSERCCEDGEQGAGRALKSAHSSEHACQANTASRGLPPAGRARSDGMVPSQQACKPHLALQLLSSATGCRPPRTCRPRLA